MCTCVLMCVFSSHHCFDIDNFLRQDAGNECGWNRQASACQTGHITDVFEYGELLEAEPGGCSHYTIAPTHAPTTTPTTSPTHVINLLDPLVHQQYLSPDPSGGYCFAADSWDALPVATVCFSCVRTHN